MLRFFFVRHAQSEANVLGIFSNTGWKHPLTDLGRTQAKGLAEYLANEKVTKIFSSPVMRAVQTSEILSERLGIRLPSPQDCANMMLEILRVCP